MDDETVGKCIQEKLQKFRTDHHLDFASIALNVARPLCQKEIRWHFAAGNTSEDYQEIRLQVGKGIAGLVWRTGRKMKAVDIQNQKQLLLEFPIARMERLNELFACPILIENQLFAVLLVGQRRQQHLTSEIEHETECFSEELSKLIEKKGWS